MKLATIRSPEFRSDEGASMDQSVISRRQVTAQLLELGVEPGGLLVVHTSFSKVGPVEGGPDGLIDALEESLGPTGTLVMPSMSDDDDHPFDAQVTPCRGMGVIAETFWRRQGVVRSNNPHAFAAAGPKAPEIVAEHPLDVAHGPDSPVGRVYFLDGQVLLLGVGHDANTTIHLAETMAGVRYRRSKFLTILIQGQPVRYAYDEIDHCCQNFNLVDEWLETVEKPAAVRLAGFETEDAEHRPRQRRGRVGHGEARLMRSRDVVEVVVGKLRQDETAFLHPPGVDHECDEARASLPR